MATAQLEKVKEFLTCTVCADAYSDPCTLMCQHSFCRNCITKYTKTRQEALQTKTIPCPSCRQVTKVPDPTKPVEQWAAQIKPSIIILGLIDTSQPDPTIKGNSRKCTVCEHLEESTPATSWCPECEMALCVRCAKAHHISPASRDHEICDLSAKVKVRRRHKVMCREHKKNHIEFHCKDCKKSACQTCCIIHHRACKSVVTIESMGPEMTSDLHKRKEIILKRLERNSTKLSKNKAAVNEASQKKLNIKSQIQSASKRAIDKIRQKEKELMDQLDQVTETQMSQLQADVKSEEIDIQMYRQHCEFIDQALNSDSVMDVYDVYQASGSGVLDLGDDRVATGTQSIADIRFTQGPDNIYHKLDDLQLGKIDVTYEHPTRSSQRQCNTIDVRTREDKDDPELYDVTVIDANSEQTMIVTDWKNACVKSFYTRNSQSCYSRLPMKTSPWRISKLNTNQVVVTVPVAKQIVKIRVTPDLIQFSTIKTDKLYYSVAVLNAQSMAAGGSNFTSPSVDILNMSGQMMKSITTHNNVKLFSSPSFMCVNNKGNIIVSDGWKQTIICLTSDGDVVWQYTPTGDRKLQLPRGITTDNEGHILLADKDTNKVIQLNERGVFIREALTVTFGVLKPYGLTCHKPGKLLVCTGSSLKEFTLSQDTLSQHGQ